MQTGVTARFLGQRKDCCFCNQSCSSAAAWTRWQQGCEWDSRHVAQCRWSDAAKLHFWGLSQMTAQEGWEALQAARSLWLMAELSSDTNDSWWCAAPLFGCKHEVVVILLEAATGG